ncbi:MAG TPA: hypothetical protein VMX55_14700 [candidate division Zixibacteria bacterium]|nr:hypothetical protein [candidate division Zixibacteria bacterium]
MTVPFELQMIHRISGVQLFSYRFREDIKLEPTLISGFISAVITFAEELKPSEGKEILKFIDRGDFVLQVEPGNYIIGLLILSSKDYSFKEKLKILVREFERKYHDQIIDWNGVSSYFNEFEEQVMQLITRKPISPYHIPQLVNSDRAPSKLDDMKWAIITRINGQNDINTISEELDIGVDVVQSIIAYFEEAGLVKTHFNVSDESILELTKKGLNTLEIGSDVHNELISTLGQLAFKILSSIGTEKSLSEIKKELKENHEEIDENVERLVSERYLEILPKWKVVLDKKAFQFTRSLEFIDDLFQLIYDESDNWLGRRELERVKRNTYALMLIKDESITKLISESMEYLIDRNNLRNLLNEEINLLKVANRLESLFRTLQSSIEREIGSNLTRDIMCRVYKRLQDEYIELLEQQTELKSMVSWLNQ